MTKQTKKRPYSRNHPSIYKRVAAVNGTGAGGSPAWRRDRNRCIQNDRKRGQTIKGLSHEYGLSIRQIYRIVGGH